MTDDQFFGQLYILLGGIRGLSLSVFAVIGVKALALGFEWKLGKCLGIWKLTVISALTVIATFMGQIAGGVPWRGALCNGTVLASFSVFLNNVYKQWQKRHEDRAALATGLAIIGGVKKEPTK